MFLENFIVMKKIRVILNTCLIVSIETRFETHSSYFPVCVTLDNDKPAYWQNVLEWKKQIKPLSGCFRCAAWVGVNAGDRMQKYYINTLERHKAGAVFIVPLLLCQKSSVWAGPNMKELLTATDGYRVINLQDEHTLRHKHYISMLNAIMNEVVSSSYL